MFPRVLYETVGVRRIRGNRICGGILRPIGFIIGARMCGIGRIIIDIGPIRKHADGGERGLYRRAPPMGNIEGIAKLPNPGSIRLITATCGTLRGTIRAGESHAGCRNRLSS